MRLAYIWQFLLSCHILLLIRSKASVPCVMIDVQAGTAAVPVDLLNTKIAIAARERHTGDLSQRHVVSYKLRNPGTTLYISRSLADSLLNHGCERHLARNASSQYKQCQNNNYYINSEHTKIQMWQTNNIHISCLVTSHKKSGAVLWCTTVVTAFDTNTDDDHGQP